MIYSRKFVAAAILLGLALVLAGLLAVPFNGSARAAPGRPDPAAADRIGAAFASVADTGAGCRPLRCRGARRRRAISGISAKCAGAVWPNIDSSCLSRTDGSPAARVRTVTIGYQADESTTVLVRVPTEGMVNR